MKGGAQSEKGMLGDKVREAAPGRWRLKQDSKSECQKDYHFSNEQTGELSFEQH